MIRNARDGDLKVICELIHTNLRTVNSKDYTEHVINFMISHYSYDKTKQLISSQDNFFVFEYLEQVIACVILDNCEVKALYVNPSSHKNGIGRKLMIHIESLNICSELSLYASETAYDFYKKLGYKFISYADDPDFGPSYFMKKDLISTL